MRRGISTPRRIALSPGQAQGPHPTLHPPLVPTARGRPSTPPLPYSVVKNHQDGLCLLPHSVSKNHQGKSEVRLDLRLEMSLGAEAADLAMLFQELFVARPIH
jgi:hypothetical protein